MKTSILNRTVLAALMGSALTVGWGASAAASARDEVNLQSRGHNKVESGDDADAATQRDARQARQGRDEASASTPADRGQGQARQRESDARQADQGRERARQDETRQVIQNDRWSGGSPRQDARSTREADPAPRQFVPQIQQPREPYPLQDRRERQVLERPTFNADDQAQSYADAQRRTGDDARRGDGGYPVRDGRGSRGGSDVRERDGARDGDHDRDRDRRIDEQRRQAEAFARQRDSRRDDAERWSRNLQTQHRRSGYRYQQDYWFRLSRQNYDWRGYDYYSDPYFSSAPSYRYYRGGSSYYVNNYAADLLRQAINYGYREGIRAGQADRYDGWRFSYRDAYAYQDASYGYRGMYVDYSEYSYYFREGFRRGYEDGYYDDRRYGRYYNGSDNVLQTVLSLILDLRPYR